MQRNTGAFSGAKTEELRTSGDEAKDADAFSGREAVSDGARRYVESRAADHNEIAESHELPDSGTRRTRVRMRQQTERSKQTKHE